MLDRFPAELPMSPHAADLNHRAYPELAEALHNGRYHILKRWRELSLNEIPSLDRMTVEQFENSLDIILAAVAGALNSQAPAELRGVLESAVEHGANRFLQNVDLLDLLTEERILRGVIVAEIEETLHRRMAIDEAASLHATLDIMLQQGVLTLVQRQKEQLRQTAEAELKFMSFFSHDLNNNLLLLSLRLKALQQKLAPIEGVADAAEMLNAVLDTIQHTSKGMRRLLQHEHIRRAEPHTTITNVNLHDAVQSHLKQFADTAHAHGLRLEADIDANASIETDADLLALVLQNIIGNAVKHSQRGTVRIKAQPERRDHRELWRISVIDEGPGIPPELLQQIFEAFKRGQALGTPGVGLGLAIASQAARLLNAQIHVESKVGPDGGSTFHILLPTKLTKHEQAAVL